MGAGGVTSYLLPALANSFDLKGLIFDADILETHNLDRQIFNEEDIGKPKVEALLNRNNTKAFKGLKPVSEYLSATSYMQNRAILDKLKPDLVLCCVDNHPGRRSCLELADALGVPCVIAANEYSTSQVMFYMKTYDGYDLDPRIRYPEIMTSNEGSPIRCTGVALESTPQLAIANQVAAALANLIIWHWFSKEIDPAVIRYLPIEFQTTRTILETVQYGDCKNDSGSED